MPEEQLSVMLEYDSKVANKICLELIKSDEGNHIKGLSKELGLPEQVISLYIDEFLQNEIIEDKGMRIKPPNPKPLNPNTKQYIRYYTLTRKGKNLCDQINK